MRGIDRSWRSCRGAMSWPLWLLALFAVAALSGCVTGASRDTPVVVLTGQALSAATAQVEAREQQLRALGQLQFSGRVAISTGNDGGNGRIEWTQAGEAYDVRLSAPVTRQSWRLSGDADGAILDGIEGGPYAGWDVHQLLLETTGMEIPVAALAAWAAGARADGALFGVAQLYFTADGQLSRIEQDGWVIDYPSWQPVSGGAVAGLLMPLRINAQRGTSRVRLIVDAWDLSPAQG